MNEDAIRFYSREGARGVAKMRFALDLRECEMRKVSPKKRPEVKSTVRMVMQVDQRGVTLYCNKDGIDALIGELQWIRASDPSEHFESHIRMHFSEPQSDTIRFLISDELSELFSKLPEEAEEGAVPVGFEMTVMQVTDQEVILITEHDPDTSESR